MTGSRFMKMSELSKRSGVPISTIRHYIQEGLLPPAIKTGKTRAYYTKTHLEMLELIRHKQGKENKSLGEIKDELRREVPLLEESMNPSEIPSGKREEVLSAATVLFLRKGYADTSIADLANHARMSKETIYQNFRSKEELFMACADRVFRRMYDDVWNEIKEEKDMNRRISRRGKAFFSSYTKWIDMMNLVRSLSVGDNPSFKEKFRQLVRQIVNPMIREIEHLKHEGRIRKEVDSSLAAYMLMGIAEYGAQLTTQGSSRAEEMLSSITVILEKGVGPS
jgi:AcrR family transcriptional regulator